MRGKGKVAIFTLVGAIGAYKITVFIQEYRRLPCSINDLKDCMLGSAESKDDDIGTLNTI